jgi:hypothetical protein
MGTLQSLFLQNKLHFILVVFGLALDSCTVQAAFNGEVTTDSSALDVLASKYARGVYFSDFNDIGVKHCFLTGTIHTHNAEQTEQAERRAGRLEIFLTARDDGAGRINV